MDSAYKASAMHKRRTGKGFKLSEEIVKNQEMYEEDDDELPRRASFAVPPSTMPLPAGTTIHPRHASLPSSAGDTAAAKLAEQAEVDRLFDEHFPGYSTLRSRHLSQPFLFRDTWMTTAPASQFQPAAPTAPYLRNHPARASIPGPYPSHPLPQPPLTVDVDEPAVSSPVLNSSPEPDSPDTPPPPAHAHSFRLPHPLSSATTVPLQSYALSPSQSGGMRGEEGAAGGVKPADPLDAVDTDDVWLLKNVDPSLIGLGDSSSSPPFGGFSADDGNNNSSNPFLPSYHPSYSTYYSPSSAVLDDHFLAAELPGSSSVMAAAPTVSSATADSSSAGSSSMLDTPPPRPLALLGSDGGNQSHQALVDDESWKDFLAFEGDGV